MCKRAYCAVFMRKGAMGKGALRKGVLPRGAMRNEIAHMSHSEYADYLEFGNSMYLYTEIMERIYCADDDECSSIQYYPDYE